MRWETIAVVLSVTAALVSGCGGTKSAAPPARSTTSIRSTTTTFVDDDAKAEAALLVLSDLPAGWTAAPGGNTSDDGAPSDSDAAGNTALAACVGLDGSALNAYTSGEDSPTFSSPGGTDTVDDSVQIYDSAFMASAAFAVVASPRAAGCLKSIANGPFRSQFEQGLPAGATLLSLTFAAVPIPRLADGSVDVRTTGTIRVAGKDAKVYSDLVQLLRGRSLATVSINQPAALSYPQLGTQLATVTAARMTP